MRFAIVFGVYGAALATAAMFAAGAFAALLAWASVSCLLVAVAYAVSRSRLLGKRDDGTQAAVAVVALAPYLVVQHVAWFLADRLRGGPASHEVATGLWLGRRPWGHEVPPEVRTVVDLTAEFHEAADVRAGRTYLCVPTLDATAPSEEPLDRAVTEVVTAREPGPRPLRLWTRALGSRRRLCHGGSRRCPEQRRRRRADTGCASAGSVEREPTSGARRLRCPKGSTFLAGTEAVTSDWRPSTPNLDADSLRDMLRANPVVAVHFWAPWNQYDRKFDAALPMGREDARMLAFAGEWRLAEGRVAEAVAHLRRAALKAPNSGDEFVLEADVLNVPALGIWVRGRPWRTVTGLRTQEHLRTDLEDAVRHSVSRPQNVEVYARDPDRERLLAWAEKILGRLTVVLEERGCTVRHDPAGRAFTLTEHMEDTDFVGIWCASANDDLPFESDLDLARAVHAALGVEVRCGPGSMKPTSSPSEWWSVSGNGERLVEVWTPMDLDEGSFTSNFTSHGLTPRAGLFE